MKTSKKLMALLLAAVMIITSFAFGTILTGAEEAEKPYEGQTVRVLLNSHPWQQAIEPMVHEFEEATGIKVEITVLGEDIYWDRVNLGLSSAEPQVANYPFTTKGIQIGHTERHWKHITNHRYNE